jgi:SAM-dependent methyltransferase
MFIDLRPRGDDSAGAFPVACRFFQNLTQPTNMQEAELLEQVELLAGNTRRKSFRLAAEFIIRHKLRRIVETGCYRGHPAATAQAHLENRAHDGQSTVIFALLARELGCVFDSYDKNPGHVARARDLLGMFGLQDSACFHVGDSVAALSRRAEPIDFIYFDSFDHSPNNPLPCQLHQLAEVGAALGKLQRPAGILLDDCKFATGGKAGLSDPFLRARGWKLEFDGYQRLFTQVE